MLATSNVVSIMHLSVPSLWKLHSTSTAAPEAIYQFSMQTAYVLGNLGEPNTLFQSHRLTC